MVDFFAAVERTNAQNWLIERDPFDPDRVYELFARFHSELDDIENQSDAMVVNNELTYDTAQETVAAASKLRNAIESRRKELKAPYLAVTRVLDGEANGLINRIKEIEETIKTQKLLPYLQSTESEKHKSETATGKIDTEYGWAVSSFSSIPPEIWNERIDQVVKAIAPAINARIKAGLRVIPGLDIFPIDKVKVTRKR